MSRPDPCAIVISFARKAFVSTASHPLQEEAVGHSQTGPRQPQAVALHLNGQKAPAMQVLAEALALAEPGGFIRLFVDEAWRCTTG